MRQCETAALLENPGRLDYLLMWSPSLFSFVWLLTSNKAVFRFMSVAGVLRLGPRPAFHTANEDCCTDKLVCP